MADARTLLLASVLIVSSLGLLATASARPFGEGPGCWRGDHSMGPGHKYGGRGFNVERLANKLKLTDDQRAQIETIIEESREQMSEQLRELMQQTPLNEAQVRMIADAQGDLKADMIVLRAQQQTKINTVLTNDQRAQLEEMGGKRRRYR